MFQKMAVLVFLGVCSWQDMKYKKICVQWLLYFMLAGIGYHLILKKISFLELAMGIVPGMVLLLLSFVSHGGIGEGDGLLMLAVGIVTGMETSVQMLLAASVFSAFYALFIYLFQRKGRNTQIPFVPFLFLGFLAELFVRR